MEKHRKKMLAPIIVTIVLILYYAVYFGILIAVIPLLPVKILLGAIPVILAAALLYVCIERIREIRGGEEDDLDKY